MSGNHRCVCRRRAAEHELDIGHRELGPRLDEGVQPAGHHRPRAGAEEIGAHHADAMRSKRICLRNMLSS